MKKLSYLMWFSLFAISSFAQTSDIGKIALSVVFPQNIEGLEMSQASKLQNKITEIVASTGLAANGYNNDFIIYPVFSVNESYVVEGGMQNITVLKCELTLIIKQINNNVIYATISKELKGNGKDKRDALTSAIIKINTKDTDYASFIATGKNKIVQYYETKCSDIIVRSESLVKMQKYDEAIGLLMSVPNEVNCYNKVQEKSIEAYKAYQNQKCKTQIQKAKVSEASNNFSEAIQLLKTIDPSSVCYSEVSPLIKKIENKIDAEQKRQWENQAKIYNDNIALEKQRIEAIKQIAVAYYQNQPKIYYDYKVIIR